MKIFHLSDLHIGFKLVNRDMREDQEYIFRQIADYAAKEQPDAVIIAGDIYDRAVPSAEAVELFDAFVTWLSEAVPEAAIMMISGNHDSAPRINCYRSVLSRQNIYVAGIPPVTPDEYMEKVVLKDEYGSVNFYLLPFVKPSVVAGIVRKEDEEGLSYDETLRRIIAREDVKEAERNIIVSHQFYLPVGKKADDIERMDSEIKSVGNIDAVYADVLDLFDYAALGHIHKPMKAGSDTKRYPGTPLACSVSEEEQQKGIIVINIGKKSAGGKRADIKTDVLPLVPLRKVRKIRGQFDDVLKQAADDYVTVILTDKRDYDIIDMKDRLQQAFPYLLEIRRENVSGADYGRRISVGKEPDAYDMCLAFIPDMDDEDIRIIKETVNSVKGID